MIYVRYLENPCVCVLANTINYMIRAVNDRVNQYDTKDPINDSAEFGYGSGPRPFTRRIMCMHSLFVRLWPSTSTKERLCLIDSSGEKQ